MKFTMGASQDKSKTINREPGISDSLRDTSAVTSASRPKANLQSGIYDVSRMTNIKSPVDSFGHNVSQYTKTRSAEFAKRAKTNSELVRGLMIAMAVPLVSGAGYLAFSDKEIHLDGASRESGIFAQQSTATAGVKRAPAARATLPPPVAIDVPTAQNISLGTLAAKGSEKIASQKPVPFGIVLNSSGMMTSPFSAELDENGDQVSRKEIEDHLAALPSLPLGEFANARVLSSTTPNEYKAVPATRPFAFTDAERKRITQLRAIAPEIKKAILESENLAVSRSQIAPNVLPSLEPAQAPAAALKDAYNELRWLKAASFARDISGDRSVEKRLMDTIMALAKTYKASGAPINEIPFFDALSAYDQIRHLWRTTDQTVIDDFFKSLVDAQFQLMHSKKKYDVAHAVHVRFALAVGFVTGNAALQSYGLEQFKNHVEKPALALQDTFGADDVITLNHLLHAAFVIERSNSTVYQNPKLNRAIDILTTASQTTREKYLETLAVAAYFRQDLYRLLPNAALAAGVGGSRFGTSEGALWAAIRKPTTALVPTAALNRMPTAAPPKLPIKLVPKATGK